MNKLLGRTNLNVSFEKFLEYVANTFPSLDKIVSTSPIFEGYEDANFILETSTGKYVLKIFLKERKGDAINSYVRILKECKKIDVPTTELLTDANGGLGVFKNDGIKTYFIVTKFFEGGSFQNKTPTIEEIILFTEYIARLNTFTFPVSETYDSWGNKNFKKEYEKRNKKLTPEQKQLIEPVYNEFKKVNMRSFSSSFIHGDLQREHILKSKKGKYCLLGFGCMANSPKVIELSTYLAWFALQEDTWKDREEIYSKVINTYTKTHKLSQKELDSIPILIKSSYAAYYLITSCLINKGDESDETLDWNRRAKKMLELSKNFTFPK